MAVDSRSAPKLALTEPVLRRLSASKHKFQEDQTRMKVLDLLAVPRNVDDLETQITDWKDCRMFYPMEGMPRSYMVVPVEGRMPGEFSYARWVYTVVGFGMRAVRAKAEAPICEHIWKQFITMRRRYDELFPDQDPLIVWRRHTEIYEEGHKGPGPCFEHGKKRCRACAAPQTRVTLRFHIPGLDLSPFGTMEGMDIPMLQVEL